MGLLDDAIRDHLELKRQHGGDPAEIERQAREALGAPAVTESEPETASPDDAVAAVAAGDRGDDVVAADALGDDEMVEPGPEDAVTAAPPAAQATEEADDASVEELPRRGHEASAPGYDEDPWLEEEEPGAEPSAPADEDVLEETPDFLQETPEHDRLWFEQKPPRDFDWDR